MFVTRRAIAIVLPTVLAGSLVRCAPDDSNAATVRAAPVASTVQVKTTPPKAKSAAGLHLVVGSSGNEARYRIREQLVRVDLPSDAIGRTSDITGGIGVGANGQIIPAESKFVINVSTLKSDRDMRDGYVRRRVLETDQFPTVEFIPTALRGLPKTLPTSGAHTFDLIGNLTVRGVTKPTTWRVTAEAKNGQVTGTAATVFTFSDFNMSQPRVPVLLSVADTIRLEYDFALIPKG